MASYEPHKMLSLKIAGLSKADQKWILKQLPAESQKKIKASLKFVHKFHAANPQELAAHLMESRDAPESNETPAPVRAFSDVLEQHLASIDAGDIQLAPAARSFVTFMTEDADDASH
jgi:hypothetical protein